MARLQEDPVVLLKAAILISELSVGAVFSIF